MKKRTGKTVKAGAMVRQELRIEAAAWAKMRQKADQAGMSVNAWVNCLIRYAVERDAVLRVVTTVQLTESEGDDV